MYLCTAASTPVANVQEMLAWVRARPGQISYGSGGSGLTQHIAMEMLKKDAGLDMVHVPYKGSPAMLIDLIAGRMVFGFDTSTSVLPQAATGRVKLLGISSSTRSERAPDVPTIAEQGVPGFQALTWAGLVGPAGLPAPVSERLNAAVNRALQSAEVQRHYAAAGSSIAGGSAARFDTPSDPALGTRDARIGCSSRLTQAAGFGAELAPPRPFQARSLHAGPGREMGGTLQRSQTLRGARRAHLLDTRSWLPAGVDIRCAQLLTRVSR